MTPAAVFKRYWQPLTRVVNSAGAACATPCFTPLNEFPKLPMTWSISTGPCAGGFNWELGPFAMFDAIGVTAFVERAERDGITVPAALKEIESFYRVGDDGTPLFYDCRVGEYKNIDAMPGRIKLSSSQGLAARWWSATAERR